MDAIYFYGVFGFVTDHIITIIFLFAIVEVYLVFSVFMSLKRHQLVLLDVSDNLVKGFADAPAQDSIQYPHEKIQGSIQFIKNKVSVDADSPKRFLINAEKINEHPLYNKHYKIEIQASVMSTLVQVFPLLGILGTILAIAQTAFEPGASIDVTSLSSAFVLAMDTTILGISFSIIFMLIESTFQPKIERIIQESDELRKILSDIYLGNHLK